MTGSERGEGAPAAPAAPEPAALALAAFLIFSCTTIVLAEGGPDSDDYQLRWLFVASDLFLAAVVLLHLPHLRALWTRWSEHRCAVAAFVLAVSLLPSLAAHPSARGVAAVLRWIGVAAIAFAIGRLAGPSRDLVLATFAGVTVLQVVVALGERANRGPIGLGEIGEPGAYEIGGRYASSGLTVHPYVFAAWCILAAAILLAALDRSPKVGGPLAAAAIVPFAGVGLTMSRAAVLAVFAVLACLAVAALRHPPLRLVLVGAVAAASFGVALNLPGWVNRAETSTDPNAPGGISSARGELIEQAEGLLRDEPLLGVGPGRYVEALLERPEVVKLAKQSPRPVHLTPYLVFVEGGLVALPALLLLGWAVATQAWRAGPLGIGVILSVAPFMLLDHLNWSYPQGLMLTGVWLGSLDQFGIRAQLGPSLHPDRRFSPGRLR